MDKCYNEYCSSHSFNWLTAGSKANNCYPLGGRDVKVCRDYLTKHEYQKNKQAQLKEPPNNEQGLLPKEGER